MGFFPFLQLPYNIRMDIYDFLFPPFQKYHIFDLKDLPRKPKGRSGVTLPLIEDAPKSVLKHTQCRDSSTSDKNTCGCRSKPRLAIHHKGSLYDQAPVSVLRACRQLYDECLLHLYRTGVFAFDSVLQPYPSESTTFLQTISPQAFSNLRHLRLLLGTPAGPRRRLDGATLSNNTVKRRAIQLHIKRFHTLTDMICRLKLSTFEVDFNMSGLELGRGEQSYLNIWSLNMILRNHKESLVKHFIIRSFWYQTIVSVTAASQDLLRTVNIMDAWTTILPTFVYTDNNSLPACKTPSVGTIKKLS